MIFPRRLHMVHIRLMRLLTAIIATVCILSFGCQRTYDSPVSPDQKSPEFPAGANPGLQLNSPVMWGYWTVGINPNTFDIEITPMRGIMFSTDVNRLLEPGGHPVGNIGMVLDLPASDPANKFFALDVTLKHPFPGERFNGFDVRGIFIHNGATPSKADSGILYGTLGNEFDAVLTNADGLTRWWNPSEFTDLSLWGNIPGAMSNFSGTPTATLNGYKIFANGLNAQQDYRNFITQPFNYKKRGWFRAGTQCTRRYDIQFPAGPLKFDYCFFASWQNGDPTLTGDPLTYDVNNFPDNPGDFPIGANCQEPFYIYADTSDSNAYYDNGETGGTVNAKLEIFDWQGALYGDIDAEIESVKIESIGALINEPGNVFIVDDIGSKKISSTKISATYNVDLNNLNITSPGVQTLLISVYSANPSSYDQGVGSTVPDGAELAAYIFTSVLILDEIQCPTPVVTSMTPEWSPSGAFINDALIEGDKNVNGSSFGVRLEMGTTVIFGTDVKNVALNSFTADFDLTGAPDGDYDIIVTNHCGTEGTGNSLFHVNDCETPAVISINPDTAESNDYLDNALISGSSFVSGPIFAVWLKHGSFEIPGTDIQNVTSTSFTADFDLTGAPIGVYDIRIKNDCYAQGTGTALLTVECPVPVINNMTPSEADFDVFINDALIEGCNFVNGPSFAVKLVYGTVEIMGTDIKNVTPDSFNADFDTYGAPGGEYDVVVTNDCGTEGVGEEIITIGECKVPDVNSVNPDCLYPGSRFSGVEITGTSFTDGPSLSVVVTKDEYEAYADNVIRIDSTLLTCDFDLSGLPAGIYDIVVTQGCDNSLSGTGYGIFNINDTPTAIAPYQDTGYDSTFDIRQHPGAIEVFLDDDQGTEPIEFFEFDYYGIFFSYFMIDSNGGIRLTDDMNDPDPPSSILAACGDNITFIIPWGEDLDPDLGADGHIRYEIQGTAPDRSLTVQWDDVPCFPGSGDPSSGSHTFSATLFETSGLIRFQYENMDNQNTGENTGDPPIALCNLDWPAYYAESHELFCSLDEWPSFCENFRAYEVDLPDAISVPPPPCDYVSDLVNLGYNPGYEASLSANQVDLVALDDDSSTSEIPLGFTFSYAGIDYSTVRINSNGVLFLGSWDTDPVTLDCGEGINADCIVANSDDLDPPETAGGAVSPEIKYETRTVGADQVFIVEWENVLSYPGDDETQLNTFQIVLFDSPSDTCDPIIIQWEKLYELADTLVQYNAGNLDLEICLLNDGGQYIGGSILIEGS